MDALVRRLYRKVVDNPVFENVRQLYHVMARIHGQEPLTVYKVMVWLSSFGSAAPVKLHLSYEGAMETASENALRVLQETVADNEVGTTDLVELTDLAQELHIRGDYQKVLDLFRNSVLDPHFKFTIETERLFP